MSPDEVVLGSQVQVRSTVTGRSQDQVGRGRGVSLQEHGARRDVAEQSDQKASRSRVLDKHDVGEAWSFSHNRFNYLRGRAVSRVAPGLYDCCDGEQTSDCC
jgi:hypothetical protein